MIGRLLRQTHSRKVGGCRGRDGYLNAVVRLQSRGATIARHTGLVLGDPPDGRGWRCPAEMAISDHR
jgi:hypothetical protein